MGDQAHARLQTHGYSLGPEKVLADLIDQDFASGTPTRSSLGDTAYLRLSKDTPADRAEAKPVPSVRSSAAGIWDHHRDIAHAVLSPLSPAATGSTWAAIHNKRCCRSRPAPGGSVSARLILSAFAAPKTGESSAELVASVPRGIDPAHHPMPPTCPMQGQEDSFSRLLLRCSEGLDCG